MSEVVVRMEMPKNCCECQLRHEDCDTGEEFCPFTGVVCLSIGRQYSCPIICAIPENHGRLVDANELRDEWFYESDVLESIDYAPTIVPAERRKHGREKGEHCLYCL